MRPRGAKTGSRAAQKHQDEKKNVFFRFLEATQTAKSRPESPQERPREAKRRPREAQEGPKRVHEGSEVRPKR